MVFSFFECVECRRLVQPDKTGNGGWGQVRLQALAQESAAPFTLVDPFDFFFDGLRTQFAEVAEGSCEAKAVKEIAGKHMHLKWRQRRRGWCVCVQRGAVAQAFLLFVHFGIYCPGYVREKHRFRSVLPSTYSSCICILLYFFYLVDYSFIRRHTALPIFLSPSLPAGGVTL
jgi:hypothetical protein